MIITILFPIDLYEDTSYYKNSKLFLVEEELYFNRSNKDTGSMNFNILKPIYHRASMRAYYDKLKKKGINCKYIELNEDWVKIIKKQIDKNTTIQFFDPVDRYLESKIKKNFEYYDIIDTPRFILTFQDISEYDGALRQTSFYIWARKRKNILVEKNGKFYGNKVSYDNENRKKPYSNMDDDVSDDFGSSVDYTKDKYVEEAFEYIKNNISTDDLYCWKNKKFDEFKKLSDTDIKLKFPIDSIGAIKRMKYFVKNKLDNFGDYQDVFLENENKSFIFHSGLSPMMNIGLITPDDIIDYVIEYFENSNNKQKQIHNVEGFIRQILGWREFNRFIYQYHSDKYLNKNYFNATNKLPKSWYSASTNITPVDICIKKAFQYGYLHHIERLMIIANFMTLSKINPKYMYKWFMEFSLDSYNWVMEFNIYSMGSYSDGGIFTSKPYISGSPYLLKMSNYSSDEWSIKWDLLFWEFIFKNKTKIKKIGRLSMLINKAEKRIKELKYNLQK